MIVAGIVAAISWAGERLPAAPPVAAGDSAEAEPATDATRQYAAAVALQNRELYELAIDEWTKFLDKFPQDQRASRARHYRGVCELKEKRLEAAVADFQQVIKADPKFPLLPACYLNLGLSQYALAQGGQADLYPRAAESFAAVVKNFPQSDLAPQALFYGGEALYAAGKKAESTGEYARFVQQFPDHPLVADALYALGVAQEELRQTGEAEKTYAEFLRRFAEHRLAGEVNLRRGETLMTAGDFAAAEKLFAASAAVPGFALADTALVRAAAAQYEQKQYAQAAATYLDVARRFPESNQRTPAILSAGKSLFLAGDFDAARAALEQIDNKTPAGPEALHWIAQCWLKQRRSAEALAAATAGLEAAGDGPQRVALKMDRAEALALVADRRAEAAEAFAALAAEHPQDPLAPQAQYLAAFTALEIGQFQNAVDAATRFQQHYAAHPLLPDVLGIEAEGRLQRGEYAQTQKLYADLLSRFGQHPDTASWRLRLAWSLYLQKQYRATIDQLAPQLASLPEGASRAEAQFLIGSSANELREYPQAAAALETAWKADPQWRQADEVLLGWALAERQTNQVAAARGRLNELIKTFPTSRLLDRAHYRLGELEYAEGDFAAAVAAYHQVIGGWPDSPLLPAARLGLGFSELGRGDASAAEKAFAQLIDGAPQNELVPRARYGRALCRHQLKQYAAAADDLRAVLSAGATPQRADAQYLLGLCQVGESKPAEAAATFRALLSEFPQYAGADKALYELAWALKTEHKDAEAADAFRQLVKAHANSPLAAESAYHVGEAAYAKGDWAAAAAAYRQALDQAQAAGGKSPVAEQAAHKLAWTYYKQEDLDRAADEFAKQLANWPAGALADDARFMQGEILFKQQKYAEALAALAAVKQPSNPEFLTLSLLHGGQAAARLKQWDQSLQLLARCLEQAPQSDHVPEALYEQGWAQQNLGQLDAALASYEAVTAKTDREVAARARFMVGEIQFDRQDHKEAVRNFFKVAYSYGYPQWQAAAHFEAGRCFEVLGKPEQARKSYEELLQQFPDSDRAAAAKERLAALAGGKS